MDVQPLQDAFSRLSLDEDKHQTPRYYDISEVEEEIGNPSSFRMHKQHPANSFQRPIYYRVVHYESPQEPQKSLRAKLDPLPAFDSLTLRKLQNQVTRHAQRENRIPTPFISVTDDLLRALSIAFCIYADKEDVTIFLVDPWKLASGSYLRCNSLRSKIGMGRKDIYNTEILIWGEIPLNSIICQWRRSHISNSGLLDVLPSLRHLSPGANLNSLRDGLRGDIDSFFPAKVVTTLVNLGMDPSSFQIKQVFLFLLGAVEGYRVEKLLEGIESELESLFPLKIQEFDQAAHQLSLSLGRNELILYYRNNYASSLDEDCPFGDNESKRRWRKAWSLLIHNHFCPDYDSWWVRREESDLSDWEAELMANHNDTGLEKWLMKKENLCYSVGFAD
ncbi:hypothetical protein FPANT_12397 [Fusarium pseudoanthophilum]|uniref:DUF7587 domain-containing protein n=1 Tax=Fusarium pseudoanthophilum TaxID=48495 RepID=A0A8H5NRG3_9HYPO|nr:hypothetical protein FPANT_12397 [Fusarium pseudoanthophilum]